MPLAVPLVDLDAMAEVQSNTIGAVAIGLLEQYGTRYLSPSLYQGLRSFGVVQVYDDKRCVTTLVFNVHISSCCH